MKKILLALLIVALTSFVVLIPGIMGIAGSKTTFERTYGGAGTDGGIALQTSDGGYLLAGSTNSFGAGGFDAWVLKLDSTGTITWQKTYGGTGDESGTIRQTSDGGYILAGFTKSFGAGGSDAWLLKLTSTGTITWQKTYGGTGDDFAASVQQTSDGGYVVGGFTASFGAGGQDFWVLKVDSGGSITPACSLGVKSSGTSAMSTATTTSTTGSVSAFTPTVTSTSVTGTAATGVSLTVQC